MKSYNLRSALHEGLMLLDLDAGDRDDVIHALAERLEGRPEVGDCKRLAADALLREEELSTAIEGGVALPHARSSAAHSMICSFARLARPVDFGAPDGRGTDLVFFTAIPANQVTEYLHLTAALVRRLAGPGVIDRLRDAGTTSELIEILSS